MKKDAIKKEIHYKETRYGFEYGSADVVRFFSDGQKGWATIGIITPKHKRGIQIYVTKTGKVRIHSEEGGEWRLDKKAL